MAHHAFRIENIVALTWAICAMDSTGRKHPHEPTTRFDGGELNCGNGLLLLIRKHIDPLAAGQLLEILSTESSVREDLPSWCRLTGNDLVSQIERDGQTSFLVSKGLFVAPVETLRGATGASAISASARIPMPITQSIKQVQSRWMFRRFSRYQ